jgi:hypothetical protein
MRKSTQVGRVYCKRWNGLIRRNDYGITLWFSRLNMVKVSHEARESGGPQTIKKIYTRGENGQQEYGSCG